MPLQVFRILLLALVGVGQTLLLAFAWGFLGVVLKYQPLTLYFPVAHLVFLYPSETTLVVTLVGTILSVATTSCFSFALKEALRHRMHKPISLIKLTCGITLARGGFLISLRHVLTTLVTIGMFALTKMMVSSWSTLLAPTLVAHNDPVTGSELDLNDSYFELQLGNQLLSSGGALAQGNSLEIIDTDGFLSGIATAQYSFGVSGALSFNGASYNVSTGGVLPAAPGFLGSSQLAQPNNTGLSFVGGYVPTNAQFSQSQAIFSNFTMFQQGLTADVTCSQVEQQTIGSPQTTQVPVDIFTGNTTYLDAWAYSLTCDQGNPAHQDYVTRPTNQVLSTSLVYSLVCPYPLGQSNIDWSKFNVTSQGVGRYQFLQLTTCEIAPKLTSSLVSYANATLNVTILNSTALSSTNTNLALFLASIVNYHAGNAQGLVSNSIGDALYSIAASTNTSMNNDGSMDPRLITELEQYWRGVVEFSGTYLRSGFSASPINIPADGSVSVTGYRTVTTMGWSKHSPTYLYTVLPVTFFALLTYGAIGYTLWQIFAEQRNHHQFATFDPTNPIHLIMVSSTRAPEENGALNLEGECLGAFDERGIQKNEDLQVKLDDVDSTDKRVRKRFMNWTSRNAS